MKEGRGCLSELVCANMVELSLLFEEKGGVNIFATIYLSELVCADMGELSLLFGREGE